MVYTLWNLPSSEVPWYAVKFHGSNGRFHGLLELAQKVTRCSTACHGMFDGTPWKLMEFRGTSHGIFLGTLWYSMELPMEYHSLQEIFVGVLCYSGLRPKLAGSAREALWLLFYYRCLDQFESVDALLMLL